MEGHDQIMKQETTCYFYEQLGAPTLLYYKHHHDVEAAPASASESASAVLAEEYIPQVQGTFHSWQQGKGELLEDLNFSQMKVYTSNIIYEWINRSNRARTIKCFPNTLGRNYYSTVTGEDLLRREFDNVSPYFKFPLLLLKNDKDDDDDDDVEDDVGDVEDDSSSLLLLETEERVRQKLKCVMDQRMKRVYALPRNGLSTPFVSERQELREPLLLLGSPSSSYMVEEGTMGGQGTMARATIPTPAMESIQDMPFYYGNCLTLLAIEDDNDDDSNDGGSNVLVLYSKGQSLAVSCIDFSDHGGGVGGGGGATATTGTTSSATKNSKRNVNVTQMDVGARIMQIEGCFDAHSVETIPQKTLSVVRTSKDCVLVECDYLTTKDASCSSDRTKRESNAACTRSIQLKKIATLSYHDNDGNSMEPIYVSTRKQNSIMYGGSMLPTFATLCKSNTDLVMGEYGPCTIYHTTCDGGSDNIQSQRYEITNLASISQIHFSQMHPMVLWSAGRSKRNHELYLGKGYHRRPAIGFGHSLHSIDLRSSKASLVWSQSDDEYMPENMQSISGILVDECDPFSLYISSYSSGKLYHVDARMPARTLCSWYLPSICSEERMYNSPSGIYGSGTLLTKPILGSCVISNRNDVPILGASKEPNAFGFHLYQKPIKLPHFQTRNLERVAGHGMDATDTFAKSSFFPLPVVSESVFTTGIAAFYQPLSCLVDDVNSFGYDFEPEFALCVICANSLGNLYSYTLAACPQDREGKSRPVKGGPLGSCAVPVPLTPKDEQIIAHDSHTQGKLYWTLSNTYPNQVDTNYEPHELPPTQYKILDPIRTSQMATRIPKRRLLELDHPNHRMCIGPLNKPPPQRRSLIAHRPIQKSTGNIPRSRSYPVKEPSEDLQTIVSKLRAKKGPLAK